jgi:hypothetical protein
LVAFFKFKDKLVERKSATARLLFPCFGIKN